MKQKKLSEIIVRPAGNVEAHKARKELEALMNKAAQDYYHDILSVINSGFWTLLIEDDELYEDVLRPFILEQMVFNNYELTKNGKRLLVTHNHQNFVSKADIYAYIDTPLGSGSKKLKNYLNQVVREYDKELFDTYIANKKSEFIKKFVTSGFLPEDLQNIVDKWRDTLDYYILDELYFSRYRNIVDFKEYMNKKLQTAELFIINENLIKKRVVEKFKPYMKDTKLIRLIKELVHKNFVQLLREYPESKITQLLNKWEIKAGTSEEEVARRLITRFEQIKGAIDSKRAMLPTKITSEIPDLKNIDLYSFEQLVALIKAYPESEDKIKKEAIKMFVKKEVLPRDVAQSYVARFMNKRNDLKYAVQDGIEGLYTKQEVLDFIPRSLQQDGRYLDPRNYKWEDFEQMLDALFPSQKKAEDSEINTAESTGDKIYDKDGIEIYKCDEQSKCILYNPTQSTGRKKYGWCVSTPGGGMYDTYRFGDTAPTFYFIFDRNKSSEPMHPPFQDKWHAIVIQVGIDKNSYVVTSANNDRDHKFKSWDEISTLVPSDTWNKIKNLKEYINPVPLSRVEVGRKLAAGRSLSVEEFKELSEDEKILYVLGKSSKNNLSKNILEILPHYKINYEGRTTTLANIAIDAGQDFEYELLEKYENLAKRYAIFRSRHTQHGQKPIPLPFVKYLDDAGKEKYLSTFNDSLTFEYIEKYFGEKAAKDYTNSRAKVFGFLPSAAFKYITDPKVRKIYTLLGKSTANWINEKDTNVDEESLKQKTVMPRQIVNPVPFTYREWKSLNLQERQILVQLAKKYSGKAEYIELLYALPIVVLDQGTDYVLVVAHTDDAVYNTYNDWILADMNGNKKEAVSGEDITLNGISMDSLFLYPPYEIVINYSDLNK
jgi:hypothetical protein